MTIKEITLISKNPDKITAANNVFSRCGVLVVGTDLEIPEIQADTSLDIARYTALEAHKILNTPVIREDHSFFLGDTGIPGPYMTYFDKRIRTDKLTFLLEALHITKGYFELAAAFIDGSGKLHEFSYRVPVVFETAPRGDESQNWERLMRFPDSNKVFAEYPSSERSTVWAKNYEQIAKLVTAQSTH